MAQSYNPFYVSPFQGEGLVSIGQSLVEAKRRRENEDRNNAMKQAAKAAYTSGNFDDIANVAMEFPEIGKQLSSLYNFKNAETKKNFEDSLFQTLATSGDMGTAQKIAENRIQKVLDHGGDASDTVNDIGLLRSNPEQYFQNVEELALITNPSRYKSWKSANQEPKAPPHTNIKETASGGLMGYNPQTRQYEKLTTPESVMARSPSTVVNISKQPEFNKEIQRENAKAFSDITKKSAKNRSDMSKINALYNINEKAFSGGGSEKKLELGKIASNLGIDVKGLPESEAFQAISNELVLDKSQQISGALSEGDMKFLQNTVPRLTNTINGRRMMLDYSKRVLDREREYIKQAQSYRKANDGLFDASDFEEKFQQYADENPLFNEYGTQENERTIQEGTVIRNPATGETMILRGGQWVAQ